MNRASGFRWLVLPSGKWQFHIGKGFVKILRPHDSRETRRSVVVGAHVVAKVSPDTWERGQRKRTGDGMVTPKDVRIYIEANLL